MPWFLAEVGFVYASVCECVYLYKIVWFGQFKRSAAGPLNIESLLVLLRSALHLCLQLLHLLVDLLLLPLLPRLVRRFLFRDLPPWKGPSLPITPGACAALLQTQTRP